MTKLNYRVSRAVLSGVLFLFLSDGPSANAIADDRPNIIFILADDLGFGDLGCYGQKEIQTPNIDQMFAEGMNLRQHYSGSTVCAPSRSCLMTGLHTGHTYIRGNGNFALRPDPLDQTVSTALREGGYRTAMIGKSCVSCRVPDLDLPEQKGFDHFFGVHSHQEAHHYFPPIMYRNGKTLKFPNNKQHEGDTYCHDLYIQEALAWIENQHDRPFFLLYSSHIPHVSLYAPAKFKANYKGKFEEVPVTNQKHYRNEPEPLATWAGMVSRLDWEVGQILNKLRESKLSENTLVIFTSDNGATGAGGHSEESFQSSGKYRGMKRDLYEGGIRTPFIAWWPNTIKAGSTSDHISAFWDFYPTACELAEVAVPDGLDGISYAPTLLGSTNQQLQHDHLYWEFFEQGGKRAVRFGDWKAVQNDVLKRKTGKVELYHLIEDPEESKNLATMHPMKVKKALQLFESSRSPSPINRFNFKSKTRNKVSR